MGSVPYNHPSGNIYIYTWYISGIVSGILYIATCVIILGTYHPKTRTRNSYLTTTTDHPPTRLQETKSSDTSTKLQRRLRTWDDNIQVTALVGWYIFQKQKNCILKRFLRAEYVIVYINTYMIYIYISLTKMVCLCRAELKRLQGGGLLHATAHLNRCPIDVILSDV